MGQNIINLKFFKQQREFYLYYRDKSKTKFSFFHVFE